MSITKLSAARRASASNIGRLHPEAVDWSERVNTNSGTVSPATMLAVSTFCRAIDAESGLRGAILRLNLFCGNQLAAALVPLYRGASQTGTQLGNTTDTNFNFVAGDYAENGTSGGLKGNGTTKYLNTGLNYSDLASANSSHLSASGTDMETSGDRMLMGSFLFPGDGSFLPTLWVLDAFTSGGRGYRSTGGTGMTALAPNPGSVDHHMIGTRTSSSLATLYRGGAGQAATASSPTPATAARNTVVFAGLNGTTVSNYTAARLRMYSIGNGLTAAQAMAFSRAVYAFNETMGRV